MTTVDPDARYSVRRRRMGTVHIVRWWEVLLDGDCIDVYEYEDRGLAEAYVAYMNGPRPTIPLVRRANG